MRPLWSGAVTFGLINIPIRLYSATFDRGINFDMLHKKDLSPIRFARICKAEEKEVPYEEIVKGYQVEKGQYVVITDEDFVKASPKKSKTLEILTFVKEDEVDPLYFEKPYFLEPDKGAAKTYLLLNEALKKSKKVGVVSYVLHSKAHLGLIKPQGRGIILHQLRFHSDLKNFAEIELPVAKLQQKEVDFAVKLIDQLSGHFHPESYKDTYTEDLKQLIAEKTKGKKMTKKTEKEPVKTQVGDIMKQLKASLEKYPGRSRLPARSRNRLAKGLAKR